MAYIKVTSEGDVSRMDLIEILKGPDWSELLKVIIPTGAALLALWAPLREAATKRDVESMRQFSEILTVASGSRRTGESEPELAEQLAHIELVGELGRRHKRLREAARVALAQLAHMTLGETMLAFQNVFETPAKVRVSRTAQQVLRRMEGRKLWKRSEKKKSDGSASKSAAVVTEERPQA